MLPARHRLRSPAEFQATTRRGRKSAQPHLVAYLLRADPTSADTTARIGFVVSKQIGNAVTRHAVTRRLRHALHPHLAALPLGSRLVVRALPSAADAPYALLRVDVDAALTTLLATEWQARP